MNSQASAARATTAPSSRTRVVINSGDREVHVPASAFTLRGFREWADSDDFPACGRLSYLNGTLVIDMSPESLETHNKVKTEVTRAVATMNGRDDLGEVYSDRALVTNADADLSTEPDCAFVAWETLESGRVKLVPRSGDGGDYLEIEGAPDWVLEIVSTSSVRKDTQDLRQAYHKAGVREYWLIDARGEEIVFTILLREEDGYVPAKVAKGWQRSEVFGRTFQLTRKRGRLGLWRYTLKSRK